MRAPEFWQRDGLAAKALAPLGALYGLATRCREKTARRYRSHVRVLCVGNLTAGGSGKTPVAEKFAAMLQARGAKPVLLLRGYGGAEHGPLIVDPARHGAADVGDEALLHARRFPTIIARDRAAGARLAETLTPDVIVMDDGLQNFSLAKDLSVLVVDGENGFGNGRLIPAGPLRERPADGLARASAVVLIGRNTRAWPDFSGPVLRAELVSAAKENLSGRKLFAFAGIGRPEKFRQTLLNEGAVLAGWRAFPDHHPFTAAELEKLRDDARREGAALITTEKDFVRLAPHARNGITPFPVELRFDDPAAAETLLDRLAIQPAKPPQ